MILPGAALVYPRRSAPHLVNGSSRCDEHDSLGTPAQQRALLALGASLNPDEVLRAITRQACILTASARSSVYLFDTETDTLQCVAGHHAPEGLVGTRLWLNKGTVGRAFVARSARVLISDEARPDQPHGGCHTAVVPLVARRKRLGVLEVMRGRRARPFDARDAATLERFAPIAAQALANAQEFYRSVQAIGQFQIANERLRTMGNIAQSVIDVGPDLDRLLAQVVEGTCRSLRLCGGAVRLYDERTGQLITLVERDMPDVAHRPLMPHAAIHVEPLNAGEDLGTLITLSLVAKDRAIGVLDLVAPPGHQITSDDRDVLSIVASQLALGIENARLFRQVQAEEQWQRAILSSTDNVVFSVDADGRLLTANMAAERAFGFQEACVGQAVSQVTTNVALNLALEQAVSRRDTHRRTFQIPLADDRLLFSSMSPILSPDGTAQGWVFVMQDITQFQEMEKLRADMILTASHELRNPINLTVGALELVEKRIGVLDESQREAMDLARLGLQRANTLIADLLNLERIERRVGLKMLHCDCAALLSMIGMEFRLRAEERRIDLQVRALQSPLVVWGDERLLYRVLSNLVDNALKYTPGGGDVVIEGHFEAGQVLLQVADTGPGIPLEAQPYVFERFYRLDSQPDGVTGTGLGLTIVKSIVEQHGGRVWVTSQPGHGSVFTVSLPAFQPVNR
jgi:two-component system phosphate regulon sensor histidine kinase PhoR